MMNPRNLHLRSLALALGGLLCLQGAARAARPNIILILTDDQGYGDLGLTGNRLIDTPNLDALGRQSARLSRFYVSPVCSPTRACLMTGRYNYRTRVVDTWVGRSMMDPSEVTVAEILRDAGYRTGIFGKWHLGDCYPMRPMDQGFEESLVCRGGGLGQAADPIGNDSHYTNPILIRQGKEVHTHGYCTDVFFSAAMKFIARAHRAGQPFFVYLPTNAPHEPLGDVPMKLYEKYRHRDLSSIIVGPKSAKAEDDVARIFAMIENIDQNVGRLMHQLTNLGIARNTIVIFMVDNGPNTRRYVGPFRGMKGQVYEGGIHSPFFFRWPARVKPGVVSNLPAAHIDILPTLLDAAGVPKPKGLKLDGRSLMPLLLREKVAWPHRILFIQSERGSIPVEYDNFAAIGERWELVHATGFAISTPEPQVPYELYDIPRDPGERHNLAAEHPEIVQRMRNAYARWFQDVSSTRPDNYAPPPIVLSNRGPAETVLTRQDWQRTSGRWWGDGGFWKMKAVNDDVYSAEAIYTHPVKGLLRVRIGLHSFFKEVAQPQTEMTIPDVTIPRGPTDIECYIENGDFTEAVYQLILRRTSTP